MYRLLKQAKKDNESFSDVIEEALTSQPLNIKDFYGLLKDSQILEDLEKHSNQERESARFRL